MRRPLPELLTKNTRLPVIAAPMFLVSGVDLVSAACRAGVIAAFPAPNCRKLEDLDAWMTHFNAMAAESPTAAPWAANLVVHRSYDRRAQELELVVKHRAPLVITALGSPRELVESVHGYGGLVFADVISPRYAKKAIDAGVDGLVLVGAGAGGHTGNITGFAFVDAVRAFWDGLVVLGGGIASGRGVRAAQTLGADLAYVGTRFVATRESMAAPEYKQMLVEATAEDLVLSDGITGVNASWLKASLARTGRDPSSPKAKLDFGGNPLAEGKAWRDVWSAGQGVGAIRAVQPVIEVVDELAAEYADAVRVERAGDAWTARMTPERGNR